MSPVFAALSNFNMVKSYIFIARFPLRPWCFVLEITFWEGGAHRVPAAHTLPTIDYSYFQCGWYNATLVFDITEMFSVLFSFNRTLGGECRRQELFWLSHSLLLCIYICTQPFYTLDIYLNVLKGPSFPLNCHNIQYLFQSAPTILVYQVDLIFF